MTEKEKDELDCWLAENMAIPHVIFRCGRPVRKGDFSLWCPTRNIKDAMEVAELLRSRDHLWVDIAGRYSGAVPEEEFYPYACRFENKEWKHASTPQLAICLAAKKAVESRISAEKETHG